VTALGYVVLGVLVGGASLAAWWRGYGQGFTAGVEVWKAQHGGPAGELAVSDRTDDLEGAA
jgi:hypothetical protein